jgi:hypothetical protein
VSCEFGALDPKALVTTYETAKLIAKVAAVNANPVN